MIDVEHLTKDYGTVVAVRDLSFRVGKGEVVGFLGPNGAGKSTTLRILAGFLGPSTGRVRIAGYDVVEQPLEARRCLGYMPEASPLYPEMRVSEYLFFRAALKGVARRERRRAVGRSMEAAAVTQMADTLIGHLSKGYRQRVGLADALVADPPLLILDEPTAGLDPNQIREVRQLVRRLGEGHTLLVSTHILSEVETTCDRAVLIDRGRLLAEGSIDDLRAMRQENAAWLTVTDPRGLDVVRDTPGVRAVSVVTASLGERTAPTGGTQPSSAEPGADGAAEAGGSRGALLPRLRAEFSGEPRVAGDTLERIVARLVEAGVGVREASLAKATLEDVFVQLTLSEPEAARRAAAEADPP